MAAAFAAIAAAPVRGQEVDELIRAQVEALAADGELLAAGVPVAARNLIPKIYEARAFTPTWRSPEQVDSLLEVIDDSYLEGLIRATITSRRCARRARRSPTSKRCPPPSGRATTSC